MGEQIQLSLQLQRGDPVQLQGTGEKAEVFIDLRNGNLGNELEINGFNHLFEKHPHKSLQAECQSQGIKFHLMVTAIHGGDINGKMAFSIDVFPDLVVLGRKYDLFQLLKVGEQLDQFLRGVILLQGLFQLLNVGQASELKLGQIAIHLGKTKTIFLEKEPVQ